MTRLYLLRKKIFIAFLLMTFTVAVDVFLPGFEFVLLAILGIQFLATIIILLEIERYRVVNGHDPRRMELFTTLLMVSIPACLYLIHVILVHVFNITQ